MFHVKHSSELLTVLRRNGLLCSESQAEQLERYVEYLLEWNQKVNLISRKDEENVWTGHVLHSLSPLFHVDLPDRLTALDLGTGGGLPGIPLAILREGWSVVLMDSIQKKCTAVADILERIGLSGRVRGVCGRAEDKSVLGNLAGTFDVVLARGVAPLSDIVRWSKPYLRKGQKGRTSEQSGRRYRIDPPALLAYKGGDLEDEVRQMQIKARAEVSAMIPLVFDGSDTMGLLGKKLIVVTP